MQVCKRLPAVSVSWQASRRAAAGGAGGLPAEEPGYELEVQLRARGRRSHLARVYAPRFPKACAFLSSTARLLVGGFQQGLDQSVAFLSLREAH